MRRSRGIHEKVKRPLQRSLLRTLIEFWDAILIINLFLVSTFLFPYLDFEIQFSIYFALACLIILFIVRRLVRIFGDNLHFMRAQIGWQAPKAAGRYIRRLFDEYATQFDEHLLVDLSYRAPNLVFSASEDILNETTPDIVDLGCGTGLCGPLFEPFAVSLVGVDLSPKMLEQADLKGCYSDLVEADLIKFLQERPLSFDLAISADVLVYFGDLSDIFGAVYGALRPGGHFAFTVERSDTDRWQLQRNGRYTHGRDYVERLAQGTGLEVVSVSEEILRLNFDEPVAGDAWLLKKSTGEITKDH
ncbi:MAG: methyltransferase [Pseudomonadota bacterium]